MTRVWLALGSNLTDRARHLEAARTALEAAGLRILRASRIAETEPVGVRDQPPFLNQVLEAETTLPPGALLETVKTIETGLGRTPGPRWGPRVIDLDILLYGETIVDEAGLQIPHPELVRRAFLLELIDGLEPGLRHPSSGKTVRALLQEARAG